MPDSLQPGLRGEARDVVGGPNLASQYADGGVAVYATPAMIGLMEHAAMNAVEHLLQPSESTVGVVVEVRHLAATPPGLEVRATAELLEVDGRRLVFRVEAFDPREMIGEGMHQRFVVELARLIQRAEAKLEG
jgi:fluoroacetyl-CoA thioesterase